MARAILIGLAALFLGALFPLPKCTAQTCNEPARMIHKGDTVVAACDSLVIIPAHKLRLELNYERSKNASLIRLNTDKDRAVKSLVLTYENQITNYKKQVETLESAYRQAVEQSSKTLYDARIVAAKNEVYIGRIEQDLKAAKDAAELERHAAKQLLWKRSLMFGGIGIGVGGILTALIFVAN